jgi:hypothetical protein
MIGYFLSLIPGAHKRMRPYAQVVYKALINPDNWEDRGSYCIKFKGTDIEIWVRDSPNNLTLVCGSNKVNIFSSFEKHVLHRAYLKAYRCSLVAQLCRMG